jgi:hypothetical protein
VTYFESHASEVAFPAPALWNFLGNRFVEAHIRGNTRAVETELVETGISIAVRP